MDCQKETMVFLQNVTVSNQSKMFLLREYELKSSHALILKVDGYDFECILKK